MRAIILIFSCAVFGVFGGISFGEDGNVIETTRCEALERESCDRIAFGLFLGLSSALISAVMMFLGRVSILAHVVVSAILTVGWICAVSLISYGTGHGKRAGDVYLEVWACVFLSIDVLTSSIVIFVRTRRQNAANGNDTSKDETEDDAAKENEIKDSEQQNMEQPVKRDDDRLSMSDDVLANIPDGFESVAMSM